MKRRLRSDAPIVAGLSGGRDSSAIVCVADELIARGEAECPRLDTYSRYTQGEPFQDDKAYLTIVEQKRGRAGHHFSSDKALALPLGSNVDLSVSTSFSPLSVSSRRPARKFSSLEADCFSAHPGHSQESADLVRQRMEFMQRNGYRVILAGIGGDEFTGGVPNCTSGLADLLVQGRLTSFVTELKGWALCQKRTWLNLVHHSFRCLQPDYLRRAFWTADKLLPWIDPSLVAGHLSTFKRLPSGLAPSHGLPGFRAFVAGAAGVTLELASVAKLHQQGAAYNCYDRGLPFLDRDLLAFLFAIPRSQILRPGQYRSLMRRALVGIVPNEILNRTRKAFAVRGPALSIQSAASTLRALFHESVCETLRYVNAREYLKEVDRLCAGETDRSIPVERTATLEMWLRDLRARDIIEQLREPAGQEAVLEGAA